MDMDKSEEQPQPPLPPQQQDTKRDAEEMSWGVPPIFGNANQSESDAFKVCPHVCMYDVCLA